MVESQASTEKSEHNIIDSNFIVIHLSNNLYGRIYTCFTRFCFYTVLKQLNFFCMDFCRTYLSTVYKCIFLLVKNCFLY